MSDIVDFKFEKAKRKSGISDTALIKDMIDSGYDPCNSVDGINYFNEQEFNKIVSSVEIDGQLANWSDEAISRLYKDIMAADPSDVLPTVTVSFDHQHQDVYTFNTDDYNND
jgi:hypothetical protein|tara:strand:+ start:9309 stop:9644 length:336 start_codon:yes stop_codon:yes gene_type:complete